MKHVFHIISSFDLGGAEKVALNICKSHSSELQYHLVEVVKSRSEFREAFIKDAKSAGVYIHQSSFSNKKISVLFFPSLFYFLYRRWKPTVIHVHTEVPDTGVFLFYKVFRPQSILCRTIHSSTLWTSWESVGKMVEKNYFKHGHCVAISESVKRNFYNAYGYLYKGINIPIIFNGLSDTEQIQYEYIVPNRVNILFAGRFSKEKGIDVLAKIIEHYKNDYRIFFHIVGSGEYPLPNISEISCYTNVKIRDKIYNLAQYLGSFDFLLIPSYFDGLNTLSIESAFAGTLPIVNNCPGLIDTVPEDWPLMIHRNSIADYVRIIDYILSGKDWSYLKDTLKHFADKKFSLEKMQREYEKLYNEWIIES